MGNFISLAPLLGGLGTFAFACAMCFAMIQQMIARDNRASDREDRMLKLVENHMAHNTEALVKLTVALEKLDTRIDAMRRI